MNTELLLRVKEQILKEPGKLDMLSFMNACGTTACIGGWALVLSAKARFAKNRDMANEGIRWSRDAREVLGLSEGEAERLFYVESWPESFRMDFGVGFLTEKAKVAAKRIDHFIATNGEE